MARSYNGSTDKIDIGNKSALKPSGAVTIAAWCKPTDFVTDYVTILGDWSANGMAIFVRNTAAVAFYTSAGSLDPGSQSLSAGMWSHVAFVVPDQAGTANTGYVNAVSAGTATGGAITWPGDFQIGNAALGGGGTFFKGSIADAAVWNVALTASELAALASGIRPYRIRRANLVAYWPLQGTASPEPDVIGGFDGTLTGTSQAANPFNYTTPKYGSRSFNGTTDKIDCGTSATLDPTTGGFSFGGWFNPSTLSFPNTSTAFAAIVGRNSATTFANFIIYLKSTGKLAYFAENSTIDPGTGTVSINTWNHVLLTLPGNASTTTAYLNGISDGTMAGNTLVADAAAHFQIGADHANPLTFNFPGLIADAAFWNVVLTPAEVAKLAAGFRPYQVRPSGLVSYWPLEGTASPEPDMIAGISNGTLTGTSAGASPTRYQDVVGA